MARVVWSDIKREAPKANRDCRRTSRAPTTEEVIERGQALRDRLDRHQPTTPRVRFEEAVRMVLAAPTESFTPSVRT